MAQVVQAICPGCKARLQIPFDWLHQPIRCKNCSTVMQARLPDTPAVASTAVAQQPSTAAHQSARASGPPPLNVTASVNESVWPNPATTRPESSPFNFDMEVAQAEPSRRRRKKSDSGLWIGLAFLVVLLAGVASLAFVFRKEISTVASAIATGKPVAVSEPDDETGERSPGENNPASPAEPVGTKPTNPRVTKPGAEEITSAAPFPRRALLISVHNYLYANPLPEPASTEGSPPNLARLMDALHRGLRIPESQIFHLSDANKKDPRPPLKSVIEASLTSFLKTSRKQDRILVIFVGHTREIDGQAYLVPLEGELDAAATLIPLKWVYEQLASCPARQKILILDGNRFNAAQGEERPSSGPMTAKFEEALKSPPAGVQVWASCSAEQKSHEFAESALGVFLDSFRLALVPEKGVKGALEGRIQKPNDLISLEALHSNVQKRMDAKTARRKIKQTALLAGKVAESGADYNRTEPLAAAPTFPTLSSGDTRTIRAILTEIAVPPLKGGDLFDADAAISNLPPFPAEAVQPFEKDDLPADSPIRKAVLDSRNLLWAISTAKPPKAIEAEVQAVRQRLKIDLSIMRETYSKPGGGDAENVFKNAVAEDSRAMSRIVARLENALEELQKAGEEIDAAPKRWQANYKFVLARLQTQLAYLEDYQGLLGQIRKEFPPHDPEIHNGWRMASITKVGDTVGKRYDRAARKLYEEIAKNFPKTPWEVLAKREKLTAVGLEWQAY